MPPAQQTRLSEQATRLAGTSAPSHLPVLAVTMSVTAVDPPLNDIVRAFRARSVDALARFDDLIARRSRRLPRTGAAVLEGVDYVFEDECQPRGWRMRSRVSVGCAFFGQDGRDRLDDLDEPDPGERRRDPALTEIARRLAIRLAEPFGIIYARISAEAAPSSPTRCIVKAPSISAPGDEGGRRSPGCTLLVPRR